MSAEGYTPGTTVVEVPEGGEVRAEVRLARAGSARLRILDAKGRLSEADGTLLGLRPGTYALTVGDDDATGRATLSFVAGEVAEVTVRPKE